MSDSFGHDRKDSWKKMSEWSHSISDNELNNLFTEEEENEWDSENLSTQQTRGEVVKKFIAGLFGVTMIGAIFSASAYYLAQVLGVNDFSLRDAIVVTVCLSLIRYTDAGIVKQIQ